MPPYDPKANRPKLVPIADEPAPVDALLGPSPDTATRSVGGVAAIEADVPAPGRTHLSVVADPDPEPDPTVDPAGVTPLRPAVVAAVAAVTLAVAAVIVVVARRRS